MSRVFVYDNSVERSAVTAEIMATIFGEDTAWTGQGGVALVERRGPDGAGDALVLAGDGLSSALLCGDVDGERDGAAGQG
jgi:hypothetical protein